MTPFTSKENIFLNSKPIEIFFAALNALCVELQNLFEAEKQHNNEQRS
jgi:hypothetical protein